jgi:hypothetical protein
MDSDDKSKSKFSEGSFTHEDSCRLDEQMLETVTGGVSSSSSSGSDSSSVSPSSTITSEHNSPYRSPIHSEPTPEQYTLAKPRLRRAFSDSELIVKPIERIIRK